MQAIAGELQQVESIFLEPEPARRRARARIFTPDEELPFAGHPSLGAIAVLHLEAAAADGPWALQLGDRTVALSARAGAGHVEVAMDQGPASLGPPLGRATSREVLAAFGLGEADLASGLPMRVASTGLPFLMVPVAGALGRARPARADMEGLIRPLGAAFAYLVDPDTREARSWDNRGAVEDPATGSAAGPAAAWLVHHGRAEAGVPIVIRQGLRVGRPSEIVATVTRNGGDLVVGIEGSVVPVGEGWLQVLPES